MMKPSEYTSTSALEFVKLVHDSGFPPGVFNCGDRLRDDGGRCPGAAKVNKMVFTGGAESGRVIGQLSASNVTPVLLELGGESPNIVLFPQFLDWLCTEEYWRSMPMIVITAKDLTVGDRWRLNSHVERILQKGVYSPEALLHEVYDLVRARAHLRERQRTEAR